MAQPAEIQVGPQGRVVIPAAIRQHMHINSGDCLLAHLEDGRLVLEKPEQVKNRLRAHFRNLSPDRSLAAELIAERRLAAHTESK